ncbi:hypothetical protein [Limnohabitans sp.]|jgi:hypothetical protein|uniref:hypothetical protein n=1 Tax=Limnohabitans sp. TaxID=1907725 RepID=UPI0037BFE44E
MNQKKDDGAPATENESTTHENCSKWAAQVAKSIADGLNAAVLAEGRREALEKAKLPVKPE